ncbi:MAG: helix-turn-helix domain-containing protein [Panacagrimonas sp.]
MTRVLSTESAPPKEAAAYWREVICDAYVQLDCEPASDSRTAAFFGEVRQNKVADIDIGTINASPQRVIRTKSLVSRSNEEFFIVPIQAGGRCHAIQDGRSAVLEVGDFAIVDSSRPYELQYPDGMDQLTLKVPRRTLMALSPNASSLTATRVNGRQGAGHLLHEMVGVLLRNVDTLEPVAFDAVAASIVDVLTAGLRTISSEGPAPPTALHGYHLQRIISFTRANLGDPSLSIKTIAAGLQMSVSSLYRVFDSQGQTLSEWIWCQRLENLRRELSDLRLRHLSVTQIGFRCGFSDSSHLSRAFKRAYGQSPREFRERCLPKG